MNGVGGFVSQEREAVADLLSDRVRYIALMVFGVVLQQPPTREAPTSHHLLTYDTKSSSETPVFCCNTDTSIIAVSIIMA